jgi:hypothetical protein
MYCSTFLIADRNGAAEGDAHFSALMEHWHQGSTSAREWAYVRDYVVPWAEIIRWVDSLSKDYCQMFEGFFSFLQ